MALVWAGLGLLVRSGALGLPGPAVAATPGFAAAVAAGVTVVTAGGSAFHALRLARDGPAAVAAMVGGVPVDRATADPAERRLVNVVEEMAIASGLPVPAIYLLPGEAGINAFAAGFTPDRAVVAVTRGALEALDRDELQGVVAHEVSHLLNADARLNLRLVALVGGITVLALLGRTLVRGGGARRLRVRVRGGRLRLAVVATGLCLWAAGAVGAFFGRIIRAAVSRQRELLADAAAVQFTRNPDGLAGALAKIAERGSVVQAPAAPEVSHLFFANGLASDWLATHPPIAERIRRIAPHFLARVARGAVAEAVAAARREGAASAGSSGVASPDGALALAGAAGASTLSAAAGNPGPRQVAWSAGLLARLPPEIAAAARVPAGARDLVPALLLEADPVRRERQLGAAPGVAGAAGIARLGAALAGASREERMAVLDLALPALDGLARDEAAALARDVAALAAADGRTTVFEWAVSRVVHRRLARALDAPARAGPRARRVGDVEVEALEVLSALAWLGARDEAAARAALDAGAAALGAAGRWRPLPREAVRAARLDAALRRLDAAAPPLKASLLAACAACALADGRVGAAEGEVVRAVAAALGVPVPPLAPPPPARAAGSA